MLRIVEETNLGNDHGFTSNGTNLGNDSISIGMRPFGKPKA